MSREPTRMLRGANVLRIVWLPGADTLRGVCHCGAAHDADDPADVWDWLLAHPVGHSLEPELDAPFGSPLFERARERVDA